jgi:hypothetical protein
MVKTIWLWNTQNSTKSFEICNRRMQIPYSFFSQKTSKSPQHFYHQQPLNHSKNCLISPKKECNTKTHSPIIILSHKSAHFAAHNFPRTNFSMFLLTRNSIPCKRVLNHSLLFVLWPYILSKRWCITRNINPLSIILPTRNTLEVNFLDAKEGFSADLVNILHRARSSKKNNSKAQREERKRRQFND